MELEYNLLTVLRQGLENVALLSHTDLAAHAHDVSACQECAQCQYVETHVAQAVAIVLLAVMRQQLIAQKSGEDLVTSSVPQL